MTSVAVPKAVLDKMSLLWTRKMVTYFRIYDRLNIGTLTQLDIFQRGEERANKVLSPEQHTQLEQLRHTEWDTLWSPAAKVVRDNQTVSVSDFVASRCDTVLNNKVGDAKSLTDIAHGFFSVSDINHDGVIEYGEHRKLLALYGLGPYQADVSFASTDLDGDGVITSQETLEALLRFFHSAEDDTGTMMFGKVDRSEITPSAF